MSGRLPEKGDVRRATDLLDARVDAVSGGKDALACGPIDITDGVATGDVDPIFRAYGDLFDVGEVMSEIGGVMISATVAGIVMTRDAKSELSTLMLQAMALGVLMERGRWQR